MFWMRQGYCRDYFLIVNKAGANTSFQAVVDANGPIMKTEIEDEYLLHVTFEDESTFVFSIEPSGVKSFCRVEVRNEDYRFGINKIGIGTERKKVEKIYRRRGCRLNSEDEVLRITDGRFEIGYYFDEKECVEKLYIGYEDSTR